MVEGGAGNLVEARLRVRQRADALQRQALVGDGDQAGPCRRAHAGAADGVPAAPGPPYGTESYTETPVDGLASNETSGVVRPVEESPAALVAPACHDGCDSNGLVPVPLPLQGDSET